MAALQCELCGGKLQGKAGGIFECEICGMQYTSDWARAKLQEGAVPVDAPAPVAAPSVKEEPKNDFTDRAEAFRRRYAPVGHLIGAAGQWSVCLKLDGSVCVVGNNDGEPLCLDAVNRWTDLVDIAVGGYLVAGRKADGTVVCADICFEDDPDVSGWTDIVDICCGGSHVIGLRSDGTVVAAGDDSFMNEYGGELDDWWNIVSVSTGDNHTVGVRRDGTVVCAGSNDFMGIHMGQCDVDDWRDIVAVAAGFGHTAGLKSDGTVVATGMGTAGQCNVSGMKDIVAIAVGTAHTVGLRADGTVVSVGGVDGQSNVVSWSDIVAICAGGTHTVGLKSDGTVVAVGYNDNGRCDVSKWQKLFDSVDALEQERAAARESARARREEEARLAEERRIAKERAEAERRAKRKTALITERAALQTELANLKGLFSGKRRKEIEQRMAAIEQELKGLN